MFLLRHCRSLLLAGLVVSALSACSDDAGDVPRSVGLVPIEPCPTEPDAGWDDDHGASDAGGEPDGAHLSGDDTSSFSDAVDEQRPDVPGDPAPDDADTGEAPASDAGEPDIGDPFCLTPDDFPGVARPSTINVVDWSDDELQQTWEYNAVNHMWARIARDAYSHAAPVGNLSDMIAWQSEGLEVFWRTLRLDLAEWTDVPLLMRVLETEAFDGYERRKIDYLVQPGLRIPAWLFVPDGADNAPGIVFWHGHGNGGKDEPAAAGGYTSSNYHRAAAIDLVRAGYVVLVPDIRTFGETGNWGEHIHFTRALVAHGMVAMGFFVADAMVAVDVLESLDEVDPDRIGTGGISLGGQLATYLSVFDPRIKAAVVGGFFGSNRDTLLRLENDDCQYIQSLAHTMDMADVALLAAPTPMLFTIGTTDVFFPPDTARSAFEIVQAGYRTLGHDPALVDLQVRMAGHEWFLEESRAFFDQHL